MTSTAHDYDYLVIGSGFGGAVSALRLAEKGWRVGVLEQGRRIGPAEIRKAKQAPLRNFHWQPALGAQGYFWQRMFGHVGVIGGVGVGGGSLVWGAVMLPPKPRFYAAPVWQELGIDMQAELAPHLDTARRMLGVRDNPGHGRQDDWLRETAAAMGAGASWGKVPQAIHFGAAPATPVADPYFEGEGPARTSCRYCGGCLAGCEYGSKNSLDYNYLWLAERRGVRIHPQTRACRITPLSDGGYAVETDTVGAGGRGRVTATRLIVAAGVLGTLELLLRARDVDRTLPHISTQCGAMVRTNSEALTAVLTRDPHVDLQSDGAAISSDFYVDGHTHITQNRIADALGVLRLMYAPMTDGAVRWRRVLATLGMLLRPAHWQALFARRWTKRITTLTVMQDDDSGIGLRLARSRLRPWRRVLVSTPPADGALAPSYLPVANAATRAYAQAADGIALSSLQEALGGKAVTAHILGGCPMGGSAATGVINADHEVHGHPGLFVVDAAAVPANLGVNPSLTITALAERFAARQPRGPGPVSESLSRASEPSSA